MTLPSSKRATRLIDRQECRPFYLVVTFIILLLQVTHNSKKDAFKLHRIQRVANVFSELVYHSSMMRE